MSSGRPPQPSCSSPPPDLHVVARVYAGAQMRRLYTEGRLRAALTPVLGGAGECPPSSAPSAPAWIGRMTASALVRALRPADASVNAPVDARRRPRAAAIAHAARTDPLVAMLAASYLRHVDNERRVRAALVAAASAHPVWPWVTGLAGASPGLAARLLARLDLGRAPSPASFARYCGLATEVRAAGDRPRAMSRPARGESARYDQEAKRLCYFLAVRFVRAGGAYAELYRRALARRVARRGDEPAAGHRVAALRALQQAFLFHLWECWREALGHAVPRPYAEAHLKLPALPHHRDMLPP